MCGNEVDREPEIYDAVPAPVGYGCQLWSGDDPSPCDNEAEVLFVYEAVTRPDNDERKNALACMDCAPVREDPHADDFCVVCGRHPKPGRTMYPVVGIEDGHVCDSCRQVTMDGVMMPESGNEYPCRGDIDEYGRGYHGVGVEVCPHCDRQTRSQNLKFASMWARSHVCPWCSRNIISRSVLRIVRYIGSVTSK